MINRSRGRKKKEDESWFDRVLIKIKKYQPVSWTGAGIHAVSWLFSKSSNYEFESKKQTSFNTTNIFNSFPNNDINILNEYTSLHHNESGNSPNDDTRIEIEKEYKNKNTLSGDIEIICVHGTMDRAHAFKSVAKKILNSEDLSPSIKGVTLLSFTDRLNRIGNTDYAVQMFNNKEFVEKVKNKKIYLAGHSRGVIIIFIFAVLFAEKLGIDIQGFFDLGGPIYGSPLAKKVKGLSTSIDEMQEDSEFLKQLIPKVIELNKPHYFYAAEYDAFVPLKSCYIREWCKNLVLLRRHGHLSMLSSDRLVKHMLRVLNGDDMSVSAATALEDIKTFIEEDLKMRWHAKSTDPKVFILEKLRYYLKATITEYYLKEPYPNVKTVGAFIDAFMHDKTILESKALPIDVLNVHLNYIFRFSKNTASHTFVTWLIDKYQDTPLERVKKIDKTIINIIKQPFLDIAESNDVNETQNLRGKF